MDTRSKRASSAQMLLQFILTPVFADATLDQADRQHTAHTYSGVLVANSGGGGTSGAFHLPLLGVGW